MSPVSVSVEEAITSRRSVRAFLPTPVPRELVSRILTLAARAPSGTNIQPWQVHVVMGEAKTKLADDLCRAFDDPSFEKDEEYAYYPPTWWEPYLGRRRTLGWALYGLLGITKRDVEAMHRQHRRNFLFFDAPVGLFFFVDRRLEVGSWLDVAMFIQTVMLAARGFGLDTCPQAAFTPYHRIIRDHLAVPDQSLMLCGMSMGYEDISKPENRLRSERVPIADFTTFHGG